MIRMFETGNDSVEEREPEGETSGQPEESRESTEPDWKKMYLEQGKPAQEEANRLRRDLEAERAARQSPAAETQPTPRGVRWDRVRNFAETGDENDPAVEVARGQLVVGEALLQTARENKLRDDLDEIDDRAERKEVRKHLESQREAGRNLDVTAAAAEVRTNKLEAKNQALTEALARANANKRDPEERRVTPPREVPSHQMKPREVSKADFEAELEDLPMHEAMQRKAELLTGKIKLKK